MGEQTNGTMTLAIKLGALTESPVWESHSRGKNWFARIKPDPTAPGGLHRDFADKARGEYFYMVPAWAVPNTPVEFGADYYSGSGRANRHRWFGVITKASSDELLLEVAGTAAKAVARAQELDTAAKVNPDPYNLRVLDRVTLEAFLAYQGVPVDAIEAELERRKQESFGGFPLATEAECG